MRINSYLPALSVILTAYTAWTVDAHKIPLTPQPSAGGEVVDKVNLMSSMYQLNSSIFTDDDIEDEELNLADYSANADYSGGNSKCASGKRPLDWRRTCERSICKKKDRVPSKKIYREKTIETGVFIDRHLKRRMESVIRAKNMHTTTRTALKKMVHTLFNDVEDLLQRPTFTDNGGFKIKLNEISVINEPIGDGVGQGDLLGLLHEFKGYCLKINEACDADPGSYDAMILLTGRPDFVGWSTTRVAGFAYVGTVCGMTPSTVVTMQIDNNGDPLPVVAIAVAHEFAHLLGSFHDGVKKRGTDKCPFGWHIMSEAIDDGMTEWSWCTKQAVQNHLEKLERENKNCLYT